jgi:DNA-damage-inducible protein J
MVSSQKVRTNVYLDEQIKQKAKEIYKHYGISLSDAINIFLTQSILVQGLPFELKIPNKLTQQVLKEADNGENMESVSFDDLMEDLKKLNA